MIKERIVKEFEEKLILLKRVSKKNKGGSNMSFSALVVIGNKKGKVGAAIGKAKDVPTAIQKAVTKAKRNMIDIHIKDGTISYRVEKKYESARVLLKPAPKGAGIIAGGAVRSVVELAGIRDISAKMLGSNNKASNVVCTLQALNSLKKYEAKRTN